ncbi:MAG: 5-deoxy-glucuronate isomerase [Chloroflexota bacterium]|nr:5-deoxy-glucuronate isomerase [Chloroflexota bacterium]
MSDRALDLRPDELRLRPGPDGAVSVDPRRAGWRYLSFRVANVTAPIRVGGEGIETAVIILGGGRARVGDLDLPGRPSVWAGLPSAAYLPPGVRATVAPVGQFVTVAVANAPASGRETVDGPVRIGPEEIVVEVRGAGGATRQINHIITPDFPADRLEVVEVYTPAGNWSSWPPHKHDTDDMPNEAVLEEIYHYRFRRPEGWGLQRLYRRDGSRDASWAVQDGEMVLVTDGYHPFAATPGDDAYYLNALAGDRRTMACSYDPDLDWVREGWAGMEKDPRVPLVR